MATDQTATMVANLQERTGRTLEAWFAELEPLGLDRHGAIMAHLKGEHGMGHGYANLVSQLYRARGAPEPTADDLVDAQYAGAKAALRPIHDRLVEVARGLGDDVEVAPKKTSVSLRRSKQFALVTPATRTRVDLGLNLKGEPATARLKEKGGMCTHVVAVTSPDEVDDELVDLLRAAYDRA